MKKFAFFSSFKNKLCAFYKQNKKIFFSALACGIIILFLFVSSINSLANKKSNKKQESSSMVSVTDYASAVENKLVDLISKLDCISYVDVFVMIDATPSITYLTEKKETTVTNESGSTSEITTTVVFEKNGSINTPVVVTTIMPKVTGVLIVTNKINASTKLSIINSLCTVLNVEETCISLLQES